MGDEDSGSSTYKPSCDCEDCIQFPSGSAETFLCRGDVKTSPENTLPAPCPSDREGKQGITESTTLTKTATQTGVTNKPEAEFTCAAGGKNEKSLCYVQKDVILGLVLGLLLSGVYVSWVLVGCPLLLSALGHETPASGHTTLPGVGPTIPSPSSGPTAPPPPGRGKGVYLGALLESSGSSDHKDALKTSPYTKVEYYSTSTTHNPDVFLNTSEIGTPRDSNRVMYMMLHHICEHHHQDYDWYIRVSDDVIIRYERLLDLLSKLNPNEKILLGHPTLPVVDEAQRVLEGDVYCYGGPGIVFSSSLIANLCPVLSRCPWEERVSGDVVLASCVRRLLGVTCGEGFSHQKLRELFYHSYRTNTVDLADQFSSRSRALTLHPITTPQLRAHVTDLDIRNQIKALEKRQEELLKEMEKLLGKKPDEKEEDVDNVASFDVDGTVTSRSGCSAVADSREKQHIKEVISLANASSRIGSDLDCDEMLSGVRERMPGRTLYSVDLLCRERGSGTHRVSQVQLSQTHGPGVSVPGERRVRERVVSPSLVLVVDERDLDGRHLLPLVSTISRGVGIVHEMSILLVPSLPGRQRPRSLLRDLREWLRRRGARLTVLPSRLPGDVMRKVEESHPEGTVFVLPRRIRVSDPGFYWRCVTIAQPGRQVYSPCPLPPGQCSPGSCCTPGPVCVHTRDLHSYYNRFTPAHFLLTQPPRMHKLSVLRAPDPGIYVEPSIVPG